MGAVNYHTSEYITLGLIPYDITEFEEDKDFMEELEHEVAEYGGTIDDALNNYISECYEDDYENIEAELSKHSFRHFDITIKPGYYEGFTIDISSNLPIEFDYLLDRQDALDEVMEIKDLLVSCAGFGLVECSPGWCTGYGDYKSTINSIEEAIIAMKAAVFEVPVLENMEVV